MEKFTNDSDRKFDVWDGTESIYRNEESVALSVSPEELQKAFSLMLKYIEKKETMSVAEQQEISNQLKVLVNDMKEKYSISSNELKRVLLFNLLQGMSVEDDSVESIDLPGGEFEQFIRSVSN